MFYTKEQIKKIKSTVFIEIQYCKINKKIKDILKLKNIENWAEDSLYIHVEDVTRFEELYNEIFRYGIYANLKEGFFDDAGITYYLPEKVESIKERLLKEKPEDYEIMLNWLNKSINYNGFYILGI